MHSTSIHRNTWAYTLFIKTFTIHNSALGICSEPDEDYATCQTRFHKNIQLNYEGFFHFHNIAVFSECRCH
uniref:Uncharacterized protein n=1 Tax=Anguilla anguilla TaxID=7936 RepID=A0A0E9X2S2_ANGAN